MKKPLTIDCLKGMKIKTIASSRQLGGCSTRTFSLETEEGISLSIFSHQYGIDISLHEKPKRKTPKNLLKAL